MTFLGKIFTGLIAIASLLLMIAAVFVYATHTNWQQAYQKINTQLQAARTTNAQLESTYLKQVSLLEAEREAAQQDVRKLESERVQMLAENSALQKDLDQSKSESARLLATVTATEENNRLLSQEVTQLRKDIRTAQTERDGLFATTLKATTELHTTAGQLSQVKERNDQLVQDLASKTMLLNENDIDPHGEAVARVRGMISYTKRVAGGQMIEITIGADDGIKQGQTVEIFRGERYLGRARIIKTEPDKAVGQVLREFQQGTIMEGDDVATQLRVG
ncbi:MAG: hypothetical protein KF688_07960 [Pirellulales bacterium]|nr:hypothetical protein [Pirellulales bacterium]MBX3434657.1 hypothetical protein [Pirellulales bacterium]